VGEVLTVMNMKGGVGKTTVAIHIAGIFAKRSIAVAGRPLKVLAIDYDPQFNMSQAFLPAARYFKIENEKKTILSVLIEDDSKLNPFKLQVPTSETPPSVGEVATAIIKGVNGYLDLVPSTLDLMYVALGRFQRNMAPIEERFEKFIAEARSKYDLVVIDCHPAGSLFTQTALSNSGYVLIPVAPQRYALRGVGLMLRFIAAKSVSTSNSPKPLILFNAVGRSGVSDEEVRVRGSREAKGFCLNNTLKRYKAFSEPEDGKGFVWESGRPYSKEARINLIQVAQEIAGRIGI